MKGSLASNGSKSKKETKNSKKKGSKYDKYPKGSKKKKSSQDRASFCKVVTKASKKGDVRCTIESCAEEDPYL